MRRESNPDRGLRSPWRCHRAADACRTHDHLINLVKIYRASGIRTHGLSVPGRARYQTALPPNAAREIRTRNIPVLNRTPLPVGLERQAKFSAYVMACYGDMSPPSPSTCRCSCRVGSANASAPQRRYPNQSYGYACDARELPLASAQPFKRSGSTLRARPKAGCESKNSVEEFDHRKSLSGPRGKADYEVDDNSEED